MRLAKLEVIVPQTKIADIISLLAPDAISLNMTPVDEESETPKPKKIIPRSSRKPQTTQDAKKAVGNWRMCRALLDAAKTNILKGTALVFTNSAISDILEAKGFSRGSASTTKEIFIRSGYGIATPENSLKLLPTELQTAGLI